MNRKTYLKIALPVFLLFSGYMLYANSLNKPKHFYPDYPKKELAALLSSPTPDAHTTSIIYRQTGLSPASQKKLWNYPNRNFILYQCQNNFFADVSLEYCENYFLTDTEKINTSSDIPAFRLMDVQDGDILISFSSHTAGYIHGHAGIVTDASKEEVLEAITPGNYSNFCLLSHWYNYSTCIQLRLKDADSSTKKEIASYARQYLYQRPYNLGTGLFSHKSVDYTNEKNAGTQCAHLVWSAFAAFGYDIDADGGKLVTVPDIAHSPLLEVVQLYGINPDEYPLK